jgi:hypothetical protein
VQTKEKDGNYEWRKSRSRWVGEKRKKGENLRNKDCAEKQFYAKFLESLKCEKPW